MGSCQSLDQCPKCGGIMVSNMNCRSAEEFRTCFRCGFTQHWKPARNPDGTPKVDAEGHFLDDVYSEKIGYGSARIRLAGGVGRLTTFNAPLTERERAEYLQLARREDLTEDSYAVTYDPESGELNALFGEIREDYPPAA